MAMVAAAKIIELMQRADNCCFGVFLHGAIVLLMCGSAITLPAAGWPVFRGNPALTGVADGALPAKPALLWTFKSGGPVKSSAVIGGGKVFIGSNDGQVHALDFASGNELWSFKAGSAVDAAPLLANGAVFAGTIEGLFYAIDAANGKQLWKYATEGKIMGSANWPGRRRGRAYSGGELRFQTLLPGRDQRQTALDLRNRQLHQRFLRGGQRPDCLRRMRRHGPCPFRGQPARKSRRLTRAGISRPQPPWPEIALMSAIMTTSFFAWTWRKERLSGGIMTSISRICPRRRSRRTGCSLAEKTKCSIAWTGPTARENGSLPPAEKSRVRPVVAGSKVVFGSDDGRSTWSPWRRGRQLWSYEIGQAVASSPAVADEKIVIGSDDGSVYCFGQKNGVTGL